MATPTADPRVARVRVALAGAAGGRGAIGAAAELAARLDAELHGLLVRDPRVGAAAALPGASEVLASTGALRHLDPGSLAEALAAEEAALRRALARGADAHRVRWSFEVARGVLAEQLAALASSSDLLVLAPRVAASEHRASRARPVVVVGGTSAAARRAAGLARRLSEGVRGAGPVVLPVANAVADDPECRRALARAGGRIVLIGLEPGEWSRERLQSWWTDLTCPAVLVG